MQLSTATKDGGDNTSALQQRIESLESDKKNMASQLEAAEKKLSEGGGPASEEMKKELENSDSLLNAAQKRVIILETQLEEETRARKVSGQ